MVRGFLEKENHGVLDLVFYDKITSILSVESTPIKPELLICIVVQINARMFVYFLNHVMSN